jgi:hypothetical protein
LSLNSRSFQLPPRLRAVLPAVRPAWHLATLLVLGAITLLLALVALNVSGRETVRIGTEADRIYVTSGFHDPESNPQHGIYRWTEPTAHFTLPNWGPGRINVRISGVGATPSQATLYISGVPSDSTMNYPELPWSVQAWGVSSSRNPTVTLESPRLDVPGDRRELGSLITTLEIFAPDARLRAWLNLAGLGIAAPLLYACLLIWTARPALALVASASLPAVYGPLAVYRDRWMETVAWTAPFVLAALLLFSLIVRPRPARAPDTRNAALFGVVSLTCALFLLALGYLNAFDSDRMYQVAAGLAEYGIPTRYPGLDVGTKYGFGQPLLAVPFYFLGKLGTLAGGEYQAITRFAVSMTNLAVTSLTCWLIYRASLRFAPAGISLAVAATYLLTTSALNYGRTFFSEPAGGALLLASLLLLVPSAGEVAPSRVRVLLAGACLGAIILLKPAFIVHWIAPGLAILLLAIRAARADGQPGKAATFLRVLRAGALFSVGPILAGIIQLAYNYWRYQPLADAWKRTGYEREAGFSTPLLEGLVGLLFSPGKSVFLYAPVLLLVPIGLWLMYKRNGSPGRLTVALILAQSAASFIFNALWWAWTGNFAWGPRLVMPVLPLLIIPLASVGSFIFENANQKLAARLSPRTLLLASWIALSVLGALISISGAMVDFQVYYRLHGLLLAGDPGEAATIYDPAQSPLLEEPGYLLNGLTAAIHRPSLASTGMHPIWDWLVPAALVLLAALSLYAATRHVPAKPRANAN